MKLRKLLAAVIAVGAIACSSAFAAANITCVPSKSTVEVDEVFTIDVVLANNPGLLNWGMVASVDGGLEMTKKATTTVGGQTFDNTVGFPYNFSCQDITGEGTNWTENGTIATFTVKATEAGTWTFTVTNKANVTTDEEYEPVSLPTATCQVVVKAATPTSTTSIGAATQGAELDGAKTFYAPITIDTAKQSGARFWVSNGSKTKSWEIPSGIVGLTNFYAVVKTNETGTYTYNVVSSEGAAIGTAQTVTID